MHDSPGGDTPGDSAGDAGEIPLFGRWQVAPAEELPPERAQLRRLAAAARDLIEGMTAVALPAEAIARVAGAVEEAVADFGDQQRRSIYEGFAEAANAGGDPSASFDHSPFIGVANPLSPPIWLREVDGAVHATVTFGAAYEGPPGCVHGGYVAGAFDEVLGAAQALSGAPGMTGTLTVRYRNPTPLHTELLCVGELVGVEGRKIFTEGRLYADDVLCAEAEAIFISIDFARFAELIRQRNQASD